MHHNEWGTNLALREAKLGQFINEANQLAQRTFGPAAYARRVYSLEHIRQGILAVQLIVFSDSDESPTKP